MNLFSLENKIALVAGSGAGIDLKVAQSLHQAGATVIVTCRDLIGLKDHCPTGMYAMEVPQMWQLEENQIQDVVHQIENEYGAVDILVNRSVSRHVENIPVVSVLNQMMDLNFSSAWSLSRVCGRGMSKRYTGKIINIATSDDIQEDLLKPFCDNARSALEKITRDLSALWSSKGINVNGIVPGYFEESHPVDNRDSNLEVLDWDPPERFSGTTDLSGVAVFLASKASDPIHGHTLVVNGGWSLR